MEFNNMKVLFISFYYPPVGGTGLPGSQRAVKFVKYFKKCNVHLLTLKIEDYPMFLDLNFPRSLPIKDEIIYRTPMGDVFKSLINWREKLRSIFKINNKAVNNSNSIPFIKEVINGKYKKTLSQKFKDFIYDLCYFPDTARGWIYPATVVGRKIIKRENIDILFATGMPWSALVIAYILHKLTNTPFVVDFRDPWIGNPFHSSKGKILDNLGQWLEKKVVENAALVCANTDTLREEFCHRYPSIKQDKFIVMPNGFDPEDFKNIEQNCKYYTMNKELVLAHAGFLYRKRNPAPIIDALKIIETRGFNDNRRFKFLQIGKVEFDYGINNMCSELNNSWVIDSMGMVPYHECLDHLRNADVLLLIQPNTKNQIPSKLYDYLSLKRPILTITPLDGALGQMIRKYEFGDVFEPSDIQGISNKFIELMDEKIAKGYLEADYYQKNIFDISNTASKLEEYLLKIAGKSNSL